VKKHPAGALEGRPLGTSSELTTYIQLLNERVDHSRLAVLMVRCLLVGRGGVMWLSVTVKALCWSGLALCGSVLMQRTAEARRKNSEPSGKMDLLSLFHSLPEPVFLFNRSGRIIELNRPAEVLAGRSRSQLLRTDARQLSASLVDRDAAGPFGLAVERVLRGEMVCQERFVLKTATSGQLIEVLISASPIQDFSANIVGALIVVQDVSELFELQRQMASSERHFAVGQMTAGLAHDFNNVLATITQATHIMETDVRHCEHDHPMLRIIQNATHRGAEIVSNIRGYLRGGREERTRINMRRLLKEVMQLAQPVLEMHPRIKVTANLADSCEVSGNAPELRRVFTNLVLNAVDAMPEGGTLAIDCSGTGGRVAISVKDTGGGIPLEKQKMIFSPYFTTKPQGTGLGLAGARRTIQDQGGDIRFESSPGVGTTFHISLPGTVGG
jgi:PAS domain S-box-containing protein